MPVKQFGWKKKQAYFGIKRQFQFPDLSGLGLERLTSLTIQFDIYHSDKLLGNLMPGIDFA